MNIASILVAAVIAALLGMAVRYLVKNGACSVCSDAESCRGGAGSCGGACGGCAHSEACHPK